MTVRLRAHHLLCLLTYVGRGYSAAFVANMDRIVSRLGKGEEILILDGPDDVCAPLQRSSDTHCERDGARERDALAVADVGRFLGQPIGPGSRLVFDCDTLARLRAAFAAGTTRAACGGCEWAPLCDAIGAAGFAATRL